MKADEKFKVRGGKSVAVTGYSISCGEWSGVNLYLMTPPKSDPYRESRNLAVKMTVPEAEKLAMDLLKRATDYQEHEYVVIKRPRRYYAQLANEPETPRPLPVSFGNAGAYCRSEDRCIAEGIRFRDYEKGVADAIEACEVILREGDG
jgi:hypothetical protein